MFFLHDYNCYRIGHKFKRFIDIVLHVCHKFLQWTMKYLRQIKKKHFNSKVFVAFSLKLFWDTILSDQKTAVASWQLFLERSISVLCISFDIQKVTTCVFCYCLSMRLRFWSLFSRYYFLKELVFSVPFWRLVCLSMTTFSNCFTIFVFKIKTCKFVNNNNEKWSVWNVVISLGLMLVTTKCNSLI